MTVPLVFPEGAVVTGVATATGVNVTGVVTATTFLGDVTGDITGDVVMLQVM